MKFDKAIVHLLANISNMFLADYWELETSSKPFYDFNEMTE